nr:MAG TPA: hypothetical protein [Caudoviricetes sp.]
MFRPMFRARALILLGLSIKWNIGTLISIEYKNGAFREVMDNYCYLYLPK